MWVKTAEGDWVNLALVAALTTEEITSGTWVVNAGTRRLAGTYASQADAQDAARTLVHGFDQTA
ncbi:hypothetical protein AB0M02_44215 [Actinoplanes sp. NPDC051861]|uniref:hypothetical protein n=1 Tax=Actinoplanes sp. NPDC051861 TaxID=3155170 RepID=UPI003431C95C